MFQWKLHTYETFATCCVISTVLWDLRIIPDIAQAVYIRFPSSSDLSIVFSLSAPQLHRRSELLSLLA